MQSLAQHWPTPKAEEDGSSAEANLARQARAREKYKAGEYGDGCGPPSMNSLSHVVQMWPSPHERCHHGQSPTANFGARSAQLPVVSQMWQTPNARCSEDSQTHRSKERTDELLLTGQAQQGMTPMTPNGGRQGLRTEADREGKTSGLEAQAAMQWATPAARDWRPGDASEQTMERNARPLNEQACHAGHQDQATARRGAEFLRRVLTSLQQCRSRTAGKPQLQRLCANLGRFARATFGKPAFGRRQLNPQFVGWLMGFGVTGLIGFEPTATPSYRLVQDLLSRYSGSPCSMPIPIQWTWCDMEGEA